MCLISKDYASTGFLYSVVLHDGLGYLATVLAKHNEGKMFKTSGKGIRVTTGVVGVLTQIYGPSEIIIITLF